MRRVSYTIEQLQAAAKRTPESFEETDRYFADSAEEMADFAVHATRTIEPAMALLFGIALGIEAERAGRADARRAP